MNTLYNGDAVEFLKQYTGEKVDCIVTDPPYKVTSRGNAGNSGGMLTTKKSLQGDIFEHNNCHVSVWMPLLFDLLKEGGHAYIMTNHINLYEYLQYAKESGFHFVKSLIWVKHNKIMGQYYMNQFEYILFFRKGKGIKINNCGTSDVLQIPNIKTKDRNGKNLHDTEKPVELMSVLVGNSSKEGETVLDPFMGVGATGVACKQLGRKFIGCELDDKYFKISKYRIEKAQLIEHD